MDTEDRTPRAAILVVEDDPLVSSLLREALEAEGYSVRTAESGADARSALDQAPVDLILLDLLLPDVDGLVLLTNLLTATSARVVVVSGVSAVAERVLALRLGADDYIVKPFDLDELLARVEAVLRRTFRPEAAAAVAVASRSARPRLPVRAGALTVDPVRHVASIGSAQLDLTPIEFRLLMALAERAGRPVSRQDLARSVWGREEVGGRTIDTHVHRLRTKLAQAVAESPKLTSARKLGYQLDVERGKATTAA